MNFNKDKIIFTAASGRFGRIFKDKYPSKNILYPSKKVFNIENYNSVFNFLKNNYYIYQTINTKKLNKLLNKKILIK